MKPNFYHQTNLAIPVIFLLIFFLLIAGISGAQNCGCNTGRYLYPVFGRVSLGANVQYTQYAGANFDGTIEHETMDIWGPAGDTCTKRPVIIWVHGGGFAQQDKTAPDVVAMCDSFSRRGFVVASIDYRDDYWGQWGPVNEYSMNPTPYDTKEFNRADFRAMQDAKCAVRFFKANAGVYKIDTGAIFMGGTSAGAWTSLMVAYMNKPAEKHPDAFQQSLVANMYSRPDLGSIDGPGGWAGISSRVRGIISCWGAIPDTGYMDDPTDPSAILFHEYGDPVVNYYYGPPFQGQYPNFNAYWGTHYIDLQMSNAGIDHRTFPIVGSQHSLYPYRGLVTTEVSAFLDSILCPQVLTGAGNLNQVDNIIVYPNPVTSKSIMEITSEEHTSVYYFIADALGRKVLECQQELVCGKNEISLGNLHCQPGVYFLSVALKDKEPVVIRIIR